MKKHLSILFCLAAIVSACSDEDTPGGGAVLAGEKSPVERLVDDYYHSLSDARSSETPEITSVSRRSYQIVGDTVVAVEDEGAVSRSANDSIFELATVEFTVAGQEGYAVLSDDYRLDRVFYFTSNGCVSDSSFIGGLKIVLDDVPNVAASFLFAESVDDEVSPASRAVVNIGPIVRFKWGQGYPFNIFATECNCSRCSMSDRKWRNPIGCVPVAVAQTIATIGKFKSTYYGSRNIDFSKLPVYGPTGPSATTPYVTELAHFLHEVASNCQTRFKCEGSGAPVEAAYRYLVDLGYVCEFTSGTITIGKLIQNLQAGRPVLACGYQSTGSGHMWVVDGIRNINGAYEYYCNWGWDGTSQGWATNYYTTSTGTSYQYNRSHIYINGTN